MLEIALKGNEGFSLSLVDVERPGPHYTVDMLSILHDRHPAATLFFLMGGDSLAEFTTWRDPANILQQARLGVMQRPGSQTDLASLEEILPGISEQLMWLDAPHLEISGTDLRRRVSEGLPIRYLTPPAVEAYIDRHSLYAAGGARLSRSHLAHANRRGLDHGAA
jgi:nicotinate-nucleotide adenylyltransferase